MVRTMSKDNMTDIQLERLAICETCENYKYEVLPNKYVCTVLDNIIDVIVVYEKSCPIGKW